MACGSSRQDALTRGSIACARKLLQQAERFEHRRPPHLGAADIAETFLAHDFIPVGGQAGTHKYLKLNILFAIWTQRSVFFRSPLALRLSCRLLNLCAMQPYISHEFDVHVITVMGLLTMFVSRTSKLRSQPAVAARSESWEQWLHGFGDRATGDAWTEGQNHHDDSASAQGQNLDLSESSSSDRQWRARRPPGTRWPVVGVGVCVIVAFMPRRQGGPRGTPATDVRGIILRWNRIDCGARWPPPRTRRGSAAIETPITGFQSGRIEGDRDNIRQLAPATMSA